MVKKNKFRKLAFPLYKIRDAYNTKSVLIVQSLFEGLSGPYLKLLVF